MTNDIALSRGSDPLKPTAEDGVVVLENPPAEPMHLTDVEADLSAIRLLDAAAEAGKQNGPTGENND